MPNPSIFLDVMVDAFAQAIVGYAISISLGKTFALKHGYKVCSNQVGWQAAKTDVIVIRFLLNNHICSHITFFCVCVCVFFTGVGGVRSQ